MTPIIVYTSKIQTAFASKSNSFSLAAKDLHTVVNFTKSAKKP